MCLSAEEPATSPEKERLKVSRSNLPKAFWATARNIWAVARSAWAKARDAWAKAQCYQFKN
ncbi:MAG: hypothetical protein LBL07_19100 [Tannerella sp.]|jgi:hypothetical protein|nr:hypothetical protein [Tannerella sp.]